MKCARVLDLISPFLDGELDGPKRGRVLAHLDACDQCRGELELLRGISSDIASMETADAPLGDGWSATMAARAAMVDEELDSQPSRGFMLSPYASMAAALMIGVFAGILASRVLPAGSEQDPASTEEVARIDRSTYASDDGSPDSPAGGLEDYDPSAFSNVSFERTAALRRAGALAYDTFLVSQDAKAATLLPGIDDHERLEFLDRELELLQLRHRANELARSPTVDSPMWQIAVRVADGVEEIASTLETRDRAMASPSAVLVDLSERACGLLELAAGVAASLGTAGLDELDSRCHEPSYRTVALATMARRNALFGKESMVNDQLRQLSEILGPQSPYLQRLQSFWVPVARTRAGCDFEDALREILASFENRELALPEFRVLFGTMQSGGTIQLEIIGSFEMNGGVRVSVQDPETPSTGDGSTKVEDSRER